MGVCGNTISSPNTWVTVTRGLWISVEGETEKTNQAICKNKQVKHRKKHT